jgi:hypothetical protein
LVASGTIAVARQRAGTYMPTRSQSQIDGRSPSWGEVERRESGAQREQSAERAERAVREQRAESESSVPEVK